MIFDKLIEKIDQTGSPIVVGLDPRLSFVPQHLKDQAFAEHGKTPAGAAAAFLAFNYGIIDAVADLVPAVKPQVAMYEQLGAVGMDAYIKTVAYAKEKGLIVIGDIKRGDIASTAEAYADGHIGRVDIDGEAAEVYREDIITINPYLGIDSVEPYFKSCTAYEKGLFVLVKTSNPNSGQLQDLMVGSETLYEHVGRLVNEWGQPFMGRYGYHAVGAVVGATHPAQAKRLREIMPNTFFLVPGYGAQGGKAEDLGVCFDKDGHGAIVNSSRGIIAAYQKKEGFDEFSYGEAARAAVVEMREDLRRWIG